jgi:ribose/xylose/arabinose/galactoside ABC-type transport system permease subunit
VTTDGSAPVAPATATAAVPTRSLRSRLPDETGVLVALIVLVVAIGLVRPDFLRPVALFQLLQNAAFTGMLAVGMVFVVVIRDIDLSVGWVFNLSAIVGAQLMLWGVDPILAAAASIGTGGLLGLVNGSLAVGLRIPVIIITLGTAYAYRGLSLVVTGSHSLAPTDKTSPFFSVWTNKLFDIVPSNGIAFLALAVAMHLLLHHTRFGYRVQAMGSNPDAARLAGIPVDRTRIMVLLLMGLVAGLVGAVFVGFRQAIDPTIGDNYLLPVVAAVIIGGTPLSGGRGTIFGAVIGAVMIQAIQNATLFLQIDAKWSFFVTGAVIIIAVAVDQLVRRQRTRRARDVVDAS